MRMGCKGNYAGYVTIITPLCPRQLMRNDEEVAHKLGFLMELRQKGLDRRGYVYIIMLTYHQGCFAGRPAWPKTNRTMPSCNR